MMTKVMAMKDVIDELGIKSVADKTDEEFERDNDKYGNVCDELDAIENDMLTHYKELDADMYLKLRQIDLLKRLVDKLDDLEMLYDVYNELKALNNK